MFYGYSLIEFFNLGGVFMWPLLVFSIIGVAFIAERAWQFSHVDLKPCDNVEKMFALLKAKDAAGARQALNDAPAKYVSGVLSVGLDMMNQDIARMEKSMAANTTIKVNTLEKGLNTLVVLSNLAPLTGFLGTVSGMIGAFKSIAATDEVSAQLVASGIYEALITTVAGLVIAIIVVSAHNIFTHKIDNFISDSERLSNELVETLVEQKLK